MSPEMVEYNKLQNKNRVDEYAKFYEKRYGRKYPGKDVLEAEQKERNKAAAEKKRREKQEIEGFDIYEHK